MSLIGAVKESYSPTNYSNRDKFVISTRNFLQFRDSYDFTGLNGYNQIKLDENDVLQLSSSFDYKAWLLYSTLDQTVKKVEEIVFKSLKLLQDQIINFNKSSKNLSEKHLELQTTFNYTIEHFVALSFFRNVYIERYPLQENGPNHSGINELVELHKDFTNEFLKLMRTFSKECFSVPKNYWEIAPTEIASIKQEEITALITFPYSSDNQLKLINRRLTQSSTVSLLNVQSVFNYFASDSLKAVVSRIQFLAMSFFETSHNNSKDFGEKLNKIFIGLTYFKGLYTKRYPDQKHLGMEELITLYSAFTCKWLELTKNFSDNYVVQQLFPLPSLKQNDEGVDGIIEKKPNENLKYKQIHNDPTYSFCEIDEKAEQDTFNEDDFFEISSLNLQPLASESNKNKLSELYKYAEEFVRKVRELPLDNLVQKNAIFSEWKKNLAYYTEILAIIDEFNKKNEKSALVVKSFSFIFFDQIILETISTISRNLICRKLEKKKLSLDEKIFGWLTIEKIRQIVDVTVNNKHLQFLANKKLKHARFQILQKISISLVQHLLVPLSDVSYILNRLSDAELQCKQLSNKAETMPQIASKNIEFVLNKVKNVQEELRKDVIATITNVALNNLLYYSFYYSLAILLKHSLRCISQEVNRKIFLRSDDESEKITNYFMMTLWLGFIIPFILHKLYLAVPVMKKVHDSYKPDFSNNRSLLRNLAVVPTVKQLKKNEK